MSKKICNLTLIAKKTFWKPKLSISESIRLTIEWYKEIIIYKKNPYLVTKTKLKNS